ncbi:hypothetical protein ALC57_11928 [Trachymyrmex cornetzi]|uniref:Uncharacterized protein n=1 Tax=Trachymyrmex cornetzi TaxID=471704 RepID=A0A195DSS4_9HYME|nr:hypothetical protein ALC57_11928 [Trachymyrmex cornetzi]
MHTAVRRRQRSTVQTGQSARGGAAGEPMGRSRRRRLVQSRQRSAALGDSNPAQRRRAIKAACEATGLVYIHGDSVRSVPSRRRFLTPREKDKEKESVNSLWTKEYIGCFKHPLPFLI